MNNKSLCVQVGLKGVSALKLLGACKVVDLLAPEVKRDLLRWFLKLVLTEYTLLFSENQDVFLFFFLLPPVYFNV